MRSRLLATALLTLACSAAACQLIWSYDDFADQPGTGGSVAGDAGSDAGADAQSDAGDDAQSDDGGTANGLACDAGADCQSGYCEPADADGGTMCCAASCSMCQRCESDGAACAPIPAGEPGPGCSGILACDGAGNCKVQNGGACPDGAVCSSGICTSGICCTVACPPCQACAGDGSGCVPMPIFSHDARCMTFLNLCANGQCVLF